MDCLRSAHVVQKLIFRYFRIVHGTHAWKFVSVLTKAPQSYVMFKRFPRIKQNVSDLKFKVKGRGQDLNPPPPLL